MKTYHIFSNKQKRKRKRKRKEFFLFSWGQVLVISMESDSKVPDRMSTRKLTSYIFLSAAYSPLCMAVED